MSNSTLVFALSALKKANTANERIDTLPLPMVFKGSLGTGGTISTLPTASTENEGFVYIVITDGTYAGQSAKAGDTFVSDGSSWVLVPSADEPSPIDDTVTSTALTWSSKKIHDDLAVKSFTYIGDGNATRDIVFPTTPKIIFAIEGLYVGNKGWQKLNLIEWGASKWSSMHSLASDNLGTSVSEWAVKTEFNGNTLTMTGNNADTAMNLNGIEYTVTYT